MSEQNGISIRISAVTITKNEEKNIGRWLQSVKIYADEIIVVDTGSEDDTVKIATEGGARVEHFDWINDFAAAKNYALDLCSGQWIAFLDADEYFPDEDAKKVRPLLESLSPNIQNVGLITPLININRDDHNKLISVMHQLRLFRHLPDIRYSGHIHENLQNINIKKRVLKMDESIQIFHTGYSSSIIKQKLSRNLDILLSDIGKHGDRVENYHYLADCYYGLGEYEKAIDYATKHIESGVRIIGDEANTHAMRISSRIALKQPIERIMPDIELGIKKFPCSAIFHFIAGSIYYNAKDYLTAAEWDDNGINILSKTNTEEKDPISRITGSNNGESLLATIYSQRSTIFFLSGDYNNAIDYSLKGLKIYRYNLTALYNLLQIFGATDIPAMDVIQVLYTIYGVSDSAHICDAIQPLINHYDNLAQVYACFSQKGKVDNSSPTVLLALGNFPIVIEKSCQAL